MHRVSEASTKRAVQSTREVVAQLWFSLRKPGRAGPERFVHLLFVGIVAISVATGCSSESTRTSDSDFRAAARECEESNRAKSVGPDELAAWDIVGPGETNLIQTEAGRVLEFRGQIESPDSIVLLSPTRYVENLILRFRIRFSVPRSLVVMIFSASTPGTGADLSIPEGPQGWVFWGHKKRPRAQSYLFSIHTAFHQRDALLRRRPGKGNLDATPDTLTEEDRWYSVEMGKMGGSIWLDRDGESLLEGTDPDPLPGGHLGFLFTGDGHASVQIGDVSVLECPE